MLGTKNALEYKEIIYCIIDSVIQKEKMRITVIVDLTNHCFICTINHFIRQRTFRAFQFIIGFTIVAEEVGSWIICFIIM